MDDEAAAPYVALIPERELRESWQLIEPTGVRLMLGPAAIRLLEYLPATRRPARLLRRLRLAPLVTLVYLLLSRLRKPLGRFSADPRLPRRPP